MLKRQIRLKEFQPGLYKVYTPDDSYLNVRPRLDKSTSYIVRTDVDGYILSGTHQQSSRKIVLMGDSFVENLYIDEDKRIASQLERMLLANGYDFQVLNAGVSGTTNLHATNLLLNKIVYHKPQVVVFVTSSNDLAALRYEGGYSNRSKFHGNLVPENLGESWTKSSVGENIAQLDDNLKVMNFICKLHKIDFYVCTYPEIQSNEDLSLINSRVRNFSYREGVALIDLDKLIMKNDIYYYDKLHVSHIGASVAAKSIFDCIKGSLPTENDVRFSHSMSATDVDLHYSSVYWLAWQDLVCKDLPNFIVSLNIDCETKSVRKHKALVLQVEFDQEPEFSREHKYSFSRSSGWHFYVDLMADRRQQFSIPFTLPDNVQKVRVGLRAFDEECIIAVNNIVLEVIQK
ncbi:SGNH/GDSL hydrolase family protein [Pseudomonas sp. NPDC089569]|uniref:SGNH/GDSL hydrolase family protein n=1 Tax=Pseudomonas sp. NPDC089569 TaxID=3390722 RepID=UPI003D021E4C